MPSKRQSSGEAISAQFSAAGEPPAEPTGKAAAGHRADGGVLVAFEGGEGAGKSSQIALLAQTLRDQGRAVLVTHEPGATPVGRQLRRLLLETDEPIAPRGEALLFAADRAHHVATVIRPALGRGVVVLTDRYVDSSLAYQGAGRVLSIQDVRRLSEWATEGLVPELTVLLDVPAEVGLARMHRREAEAGPDRLEREALEFHERVRAGFRSLAAAEPGRYLVLDGTRPATELAAEVSAAVLGLLPSHARQVPASQEQVPASQEIGGAR